MKFDCNVQECEVKTTLLAQQDAELAAVKQEVASRLAVHQELARVRPALHISLCIARLWVTFSNTNMPLLLGKVRQWGTAQMIL
jgi:hypothetical protein